MKPRTRFWYRMSLLGFALGGAASEVHSGKAISSAAVLTPIFLASLIATAIVLDGWPRIRFWIGVAIRSFKGEV